MHLVVEYRLITMEITLAICTILGGLASVWFFWDKFAIYWDRFLNLFRKNGKTSSLSLPDDEFIFIDKISKIKFKGNYQPTSERELQLCNSLVNYGVFSKQSDSSYKPTREGENLFNR